MKIGTIIYESFLSLNCSFYLYYSAEVSLQDLNAPWNELFVSYLLPEAYVKFLISYIFSYLRFGAQFRLKTSQEMKISLGLILYNYWRTFLINFSPRKCVSTSFFLRVYSRIVAEARVFFYQSDWIVHIRLTGSGYRPVFCRLQTRVGEKVLDMPVFVSLKSLQFFGGLRLFFGEK